MPSPRTVHTKRITRWSGAALLLMAPVYAQRPTAQPPVLLNFSINDSSATVTRAAATLTLTHAVAGTRPSEYRVGVRADFANALWLPYTTPLRVSGWQSLAGAGAPCGTRGEGKRLQLYLQVRAELGGTVHIVNGQRTVVPEKVESNVLGSAICVLPDR